MRAIVTLLALALFGAEALADEAKAPYDFKGIPLGMAFKDFVTRHRELGKEEVEQVCVKGKCKSKKVWKPDMSCSSFGMVAKCEMKCESLGNLAKCEAHTTILERSASGTWFFTDGQLAAIGVIFEYSPTFVGDVKKALTMKVGEPTKEYPSGARWESGTSLIELNEHLCTPTTQAAVSLAQVWHWAETSLADRYCERGQSVGTYISSFLVFVEGRLASSARQNIAIEAAKVKVKANADY